MMVVSVSDTMSTSMVLLWVTTNYVCAKQQQSNGKNKISYFGKHFKHGFLHVRAKKHNKALMIYESIFVLK